MPPFLAMLVWALLLLPYVLSIPLPLADHRTGIPTALARRQASSGKPGFMAGVGSMISRVIGSSYPPSSDLFKDAAVQVVYGPQDMNQLASFKFGTTSKPEIMKLKSTNKYHTEHVLEFQVVKNLILSLAQGEKASKNSAVTPWTPKATSKYPNPVNTTIASQSTSKPLKEFMKRATTELDFHPYLCLWWTLQNAHHDAPKSFTVGNIKNQSPFNIISKSLPTTENFGNEFVLVDEDTNSLKNAVWSSNANIRTVKKMTDWIEKGTGETFDPTLAMKAFIAVKHTMLCWEYMTIHEIQSIYDTEVKRIVSAFGSIESQMQNSRVGPGSTFPYFKNPYQMLGLQEKSEDFLRWYAKVSYDKSIKFIKIWAPVIIATWSEDYRDVPLSTEENSVPVMIKNWDLNKQSNSLAKLRDLFATEIAAEAEDIEDEGEMPTTDGWDSQSGDEGGQKTDSEISEGEAPAGPGVPGVPQTPGKPSNRPPKVPPAPQKPQGQAGRPGSAEEPSPSKKNENKTPPGTVDEVPKPDTGTDRKADTSTEGKAGTGTGQSQDQGAGTGTGTGRQQRKAKNPNPAYGGAAKGAEKDLRFKDVKREDMKKFANALYEFINPHGKETWFQTMDRKWKAGPYYGGGQTMTLSFRPGQSQQQAPAGGAGATPQRQSGGGASGLGGTSSRPPQATGQPAGGRPAPQPGRSGGQAPPPNQKPQKQDGKQQKGSGSTTKGGSGSGKKG
ncbi:hypothetical protein RB595_002561 [Gaeumannomyces hyphopodioides]